MPVLNTRMRVANACDTCKQRKVKCDGTLPCSYCKNRQRSLTCHFSPASRRRRNKSGPSSTPSQTASVPPSVPRPARPDTLSDDPIASASSTVSPRISAGFAPRPGDVYTEEDTDVPREARLLCDTQGKLIFIGDCAPLSFFQTVRQIVTSRVDSNAFAAQIGRVSALDSISANQFLAVNNEEPQVDCHSVGRLVSIYTYVTSGLIDFFDTAHLVENILVWAAEKGSNPNVTSAVNYLILAIGAQSINDESATEYFQYAKNLALRGLGGNLGIGTIQAFTLVTLYMLRACQANGAFLYFGIAARAAYSIGVHRTEINSRFGADVHNQRDRLWKSLRTLDLFLSISMGRPPAMSDVDCTVPFRVVGTDGYEKFDIMNASVQILSITEDIVLRIYSRRKISLQLTEGISRQLRDWSNRWLLHLKRAITKSFHDDIPEVVGACQVLSSYYYAVMLVSRPFLMYELCKRLPGRIDRHSARSVIDENSGRSRLANACIDAASLMAELVLDLINRQVLDERMPMITSWLFVSSLVLGVGLLGGFGRILEKYMRMSIDSLGHFAENDMNAAEYSLIARSLMASTLQYLQKRDTDERLRITESSSQLFGLIPHELPRREVSAPVESAEQEHGTLNFQETSTDQSLLSHGVAGSPFSGIDPALLALGSLGSTPDVSSPDRRQQDQIDNVFGALNMFPLLDENGHIDLGHSLFK
ncbi:hypothetical protein F5B20DRAFT_260179 [Whalleya microplaca]|nr:hypothetical protein F5B20DRAFT_260179 [Whalleya microplaca]